MESLTTPSASPMSTGQQQTAMQAVDTGIGAMDKGKALFNSGVSELNKVGTELGGDMEKFKGNALGNIANLKVKMNQKKVEAQQKLEAAKQAEMVRQSEAAQRIADGTQYESGMAGIKGGITSGLESAKHHWNVTKPKMEKEGAEAFAAAKAAKLQEMSTNTSVLPTAGGRRRRRRRKSRRKKKSKKKKGGRKSRKRKRKRKTRKKRRRRNRKKSRRRRRR